MKAGDKLVRMLGGIILSKVVVVSVDDKLITVAPDEPEDIQKQRIRGSAALLGKILADEEIKLPTWTFDVRTLAEVDKYLGWGNNITGSYLVSYYPPKTE